MKLRISFLLLFALGTTVYGQKTEKIFLNVRDSTTSCYLALIPEQQLKGFLFLIPSFGETPEGVLMQTQLPVYAAQQGILTIIPTFSTGTFSFGVDDLSQASFREMLKDVEKRYPVKDQKFFVGGFSIGGSCALKYAELVGAGMESRKPNAIFGIDPPLDFERFYYSSKRNVRLSVNTPPSQEAIYMIGRIEQEMGGPPEKVLANYWQMSPYSFSDTHQTAIKNLFATAIRLYAEPDITWWLQERGTDFSGMNVVDASAMINELTRLGHKNATLQISQNKGFRQPDNRRHPHSWSIVDPKELVTWLLAQ